MAKAGSIRGAEMTDEEISEFLTEQGIGMLALASHGDAYAVPISFGWDSENRRLYFDLLEFGKSSKKIDYLETTETACFSTYDVQSQFDWRSAVVYGKLQEVPEEDHEYMDEIMADNAWFPSLFPPAKPMTGVTRSVIHVDAMTGRRGEARQQDR